MPGNRDEHGPIGSLHDLFSWGFQLLPPCLVLLPDLSAAAFFPISGPNLKLVLFSYFVSGQEILKVPRGVGRLSFLVHAAPAGRLREANPVSSVEHQHKDMIAEQAVIKRLVMPQRRQILV